VTAKEMADWLTGLPPLPVVLSNSITGQYEPVKIIGIADVDGFLTVVLGVDE